MAEIVQVVGASVNFPKEAVVVLLQRFVSVDLCSGRIACVELDGLPLFYIKFFNRIVIGGNVSVKTIGAYKNVLLQNGSVLVDKVFVTA